jgi:5-oxoprolinase (ATP-hydrolysing) subunit A
MRTIDLNCDMGEIPEAVVDGGQESLMRFISSANIACGGHAGDTDMMRRTVEQALRHSVSIGAHPGYEDRANFGRTELQLTQDEIASLVHRQILTLDKVAEQCGAAITHVKVHGALYNQAARNRQFARAIAEGVRRWRNGVVLMGLAGSVMLEEFRAAGFLVAAEAFADRRYERDGNLRSRKFPDSLVHDPAEAAEQALRIAAHGNVVAVDGALVPLAAQTICIHGDTPGAAKIAAAVRCRLQEAGIKSRSFSLGN